MSSRTKVRERLKNSMIVAFMMAILMKMKGVARAYGEAALTGFTFGMRGDIEGARRYGQKAQVDDKGLIGIMLTVIISAVIGYVGLVVLSETQKVSSFTDGSAFDNAAESLTSGLELFFDQSIGAIGIFVLVIILLIGIPGLSALVVANE